MKNKILLSVVLMFVLVLPTGYATAADYLPKGANDFDTVIIGRGQEYRDLYAAGNSIIVSQKILGDFFSLGKNVSIAGEIEQDLFALGSMVSVTKPVGGDVRVAGGEVTINSTIGGDLLVAAQTVFIDQGATVTGDLWVKGGVVNINNVTSGNVKVSGDEVYINSTISGTLDVHATNKLTFGPESNILGTIVYRGKNEPIIKDGAQLGAISRRAEQTSTTNDSAVATIMSLILKLLTVFIAGWVLIKLFGQRISSILYPYKFTLTKQFWGNAGVGFLSLLFIPIVSFILLISTIGIYLSMILFTGYVLALFVTIIMTCIALGSVIQSFQKSKTTEETVEENPRIELTWKTVLMGALGMGILQLIPVVGWLVLAVVYLATFGSLVKSVKKSFQA